MYGLTRRTTGLEPFRGGASSGLARTVSIIVATA
jgi:hypothetical protein